MTKLYGIENFAGPLTHISVISKLWVSGLGGSSLKMSFLFEYFIYLVELDRLESNQGSDYIAIFLYFVSGS